MAMFDSTVMISIEDALDLILAQTEPTEIEEVGIVESLGRVIARDLTSDIDIAPFDNTSMDGFALRSIDIEAASPENPVTLDVVAHIGAGYVYEGTVLPGTAVRIMTGAPIPAGADAVVKIEKVTWTGDGGTGEKATFIAPSSVGENIRPHGEECFAGEVIIRAGEVITSSGVGLMASTGHRYAPVHRRPRVGIISLGSELVDVDVVPGPGQIRNSNCFSLAAEAANAGAEPLIFPTVADDLTAISSALIQACAQCDVVVSSGGASGGDFDYITQAAGDVGKVFFKYVNMKPGKSQTFAIIDGTTPFFGLAGNPAAATVGFEVLVRPLLRNMQGYHELKRPITRAILSGGMKKIEMRRSLLRGRVERQPDGTYLAKLAKNQSSALLGALHHANCLVVIPEGGTQAIEGMEVDCIRLDMEEGTVE
jgi:molybdopterin molybdotransferase